MTYRLLLYCCRTYWNPKPAAELLFCSVDLLLTAIFENLKSKSLLPTVLNFRHDVFRALFKDRGVQAENGKHVLFTKDDFERCNLPEQWDQILDQLGNGIKITFPVKARTHISLSPKTYKVISGKLKLMPRYNIEKLSITCLKQPFVVDANI